MKIFGGSEKMSFALNFLFFSSSGKYQGSSIALIDNSPVCNALTAFYFKQTLTSVLKINVTTAFKALMGYPLSRKVERLCLHK